MLEAIEGNLFKRSLAWFPLPSLLLFSFLSPFLFPAPLSLCLSQVVTWMGGAGGIGKGFSA